MSERKILIGADAAEVSGHLKTILASTLDKGDKVKIGLSGGSLPKFFSAAALELKNANWANVTFIFCDERLVPFDNADSTFKLYKDALIGKLPGVKEDNFVVIDPSLDADAAAKDYAKKLLALEKDKSIQLPRYDLLLLGMGPDGHTCSLFPGHPLLDEKDLIVAPITDSPKPPPSRVTLTYPVLNNAKAAVFVSTGDGKKEILEEILEQGKDYPAGRVKPTDGDLVWILDQAAAAKLQK